MIAAKDETLDRRIQEEIEGRILSGAWPPGHRIPFETDLARDYGCSRMTVNKVLTRLAAAGLIERRRKSGSFVARPAAQSAVIDIHDIESEVRMLDLPYRFDLRKRVARALRVTEAARLALPPGAPVLELQCVHFAGTEPFCKEDRLLSLAAVPQAAEVDFTAIAPGPWLIHQVPWSAAEHLIRAVSADRTDASDLALPSGSACLIIERRTFNDAGPITHVRFTYPGDRHVVRAQFSPKG